MTRVYTAECELCRTKFEAAPGECPVCGGTSIRAIREAVAAAESIPVPTGRTKPPAALRRRGAPAARRAETPTGADAPAGTISGIRFIGVEPEAKAGRPSRGPDGRFLSWKKATATRTVRMSSGGATATIRIDIGEAEKRLEAAMAELREARRASFAAARRKSEAESAVRRIRNEIRRTEAAARAAMRVDRDRKGGLHVVLKALGGLFMALVAALWK